MTSRNTVYNLKKNDLNLLKKNILFKNKEIKKTVNKNFFYYKSKKKTGNIILNLIVNYRLKSKWTKYPVKFYFLLKIMKLWLNILKVKKKDFDFNFFFKVKYLQRVKKKRSIFKKKKKIDKRLRYLYDYKNLKKVFIFKLIKLHKLFFKKELKIYFLYNMSHSNRTIKLKKKRRI